MCEDDDWSASAMRGMPLAETVERTGSDLSGDSGSLLGVCLAQPKRCFQSAFAGWRRPGRTTLLELLAGKLVAMLKGF